MTRADVGLESELELFMQLIAKSALPDYAVLKDQLAKLAALVDHNYAAYRESLAMLGRRERHAFDSPVPGEGHEARRRGQTENSRSL